MEFGNFNIWWNIELSNTAVGKIANLTAIVVFVTVHVLESDLGIAKYVGVCNLLPTSVCLLKEWRGSQSELLILTRVGQNTSLLLNAVDAHTL